MTLKCSSLSRVCDSSKQRIILILCGHTFHPRCPVVLLKDFQMLLSSINVLKINLK